MGTSTRRHQHRRRRALFTLPVTRLADRAATAALAIEGSQQASGCYPVTDPPQDSAGAGLPAGGYPLEVRER